MVKGNGGDERGEKVYSLPAAMCMAIKDSESRIEGYDRGAVKESNQKTDSNRTKYFIAWAKERDFHDVAFKSTSKIEAQKILATYIENVANGHNPKKDKTLIRATLVDYLAAAIKPSNNFGNEDYRWANLNAKKPVYTEDIKDVLDQRKKWSKKNTSYEPLVYDFLQELFKTQKGLCNSSRQGSLGLYPLVFWSIIVACFTGSRVSEYATSKKRPNEEFPTVPNEPCAGDFAGLPLAFVHSDIVFLTRGYAQLNKRQRRQAQKIKIRFKFDKSTYNNVWRFYSDTDHDWFSIIEASLQLVERAEALGIDDDSKPLTAFLDHDTNNLKFLTARHVNAVLKNVAKKIYTKNHPMYEAINHTSSHSARVTAALALINSGLSIDETAHRLRWNSKAILRYLRESMFRVDDMTEKALKGAMDNILEPKPSADDPRALNAGDEDD